MVLEQPVPTDSSTSKITLQSDDSVLYLYATDSGGGTVGLEMGAEGALQLVQNLLTMIHQIQGQESPQEA